MTDFELFTNAINLFNMHDECAKEDVNFFKYYLQRRQVSLIAKTIIDQKPIGDEVANFVFNTNTLSLEQVFEEIIHPDEGTCIVKLVEHIIYIRLPSYENMINFMVDNIDNRYKFISFTYTNEGYNEASGHRCTLLFDNNTIYLVDPNGYSDYYSRDIDMAGLIDKALDLYFSELEPRGFPVQYIYSKAWNPNKLSLNDNSLSKYSIGSGQCVALSVLIVHMRILLDIELIDVYKKIQGLHEDEKVYLISSYIASISKMMKDNGLYKVYVGPESPESKQEPEPKKYTDDLKDILKKFAGMNT